MEGSDCHVIGGNNPVLPRSEENHKRNRITGPGAQTSTGVSDQEIGVMLNRDIQTLHMLNLAWR
jgi:hypothetical protein